MGLLTWLFRKAATRVADSEYGKGQTSFNAGHDDTVHCSTCVNGAGGCKAKCQRAGR